MHNLARVYDVETLQSICVPEIINIGTVPDSRQARDNQFDHRRTAILRSSNSQLSLPNLAVVPGSSDSSSACHFGYGILGSWRCPSSIERRFEIAMAFHDIVGGLHAERVAQHIPGF